MYGTLRILDTNKKVNKIVDIKCQHLGEVNNCLITKDNSYLVTTSIKDKSIFIWKILFK